MTDDPETSPDEQGPDEQGPDEQKPVRHSPDWQGRLRAADPAKGARADTVPAGTVFLIMVGVLAVGALLNAEVMLERAETSQFGPRRDLALAFWRPVHAASEPLGLGIPRSGVEALRDDGSTADAVDLVAGASDDTGRLGHEPLPTGPAGPTLAPTPATPEPSASEPSVPDPSVPDPAVSEPTTSLDPQGQPVPESPVPAPPTLTDGVPTPAPAPATTTPPTTAPPTTAPATTADEAPLRRPTAADPLRVLVIGDSTMDAVGTSMLRELTATGVTEASLDFRISTGLSRPDFFDWPAHLREVRAAERTEVVVIMMGANDAQPFMIGDIPESYGTERWFATYRQRVADLLTELTADGGWVLWIGQPVMRNQEFDAKMQVLNQIYLDELARHPRAMFVDSRTVMSDENGGYSAYLPDATGDQQLVRQTDGVHLTSAGGDRLAPVIIARLNEIAPLR